MHSQGGIMFTIHYYADGVVNASRGMGRVEKGERGGTSNTYAHPRNPAAGRRIGYRAKGERANGGLCSLRTKTKNFRMIF